VGPEISVASTKAFTSQVIAMVIFGLTIAQAKGVKPGILYPYIKEIAAMPEAIRETLDTVHEKVKKTASKYTKYDHAVYLGRDTAYPTAMEGALKLKEISYVDANAYAFGELKHGPLALIDDRFFEMALLPEGHLYDKAISNVQEVLARGGHIIAVTNVKKFDMPVDDIIEIPDEIKLFAPILMNLVSQLFAYYMTVEKGYNVDQPRNLAKSVTVE
jgi:glucosamine--fructose-6-phosphate aminotransferase (isomerizing)